jgi:phytoene dehydrogenase-like protein
MPEVFEEFFTLFGRPREDLYRLATLDPSYRVFFGKGEVLDIVPELAKNLAAFERLEPGGAERLQTCLADARHKYEIALKDFLYRVNTLAEIIMYASVAVLAVALFMITRPPAGTLPCSLLPSGWLTLAFPT